MIMASNLIQLSHSCRYRIARSLTGTERLVVVVVVVVISATYHYYSFFKPGYLTGLTDIVCLDRFCEHDAEI